MATAIKIDFPKDDEFHSVYSPIKFLYQVTGGDTDGLTGTVTDFVSCRFHFTPFNETTDQWQNGNNSNSYTNTALPNETFSVRVPFVPFLHTHSIDSSKNEEFAPGGTASNRLFNIDVAPLLRSHLSYNLRPCSHDTHLQAKRDITLGQISYNLFKYYQVGITPEYINGDGKLVLADGGSGRPNLRDFCYPRVINAALSYNEEFTGYFSKNVVRESSANTTNTQHTVMKDMYVHDSNVTINKYGRMKYLSVKPTTRVIGEDECEYLTFAAKNGADGIYAVVTFYDFDGNVIDNGEGTAGAGYLGININATADGDGSNSANNALFSYGDGSNTNPIYAVIQIGVGTRNIKELAVMTPSKFRNSQPVSDFSNIAYYTVSTHRDASPYEQIGETITYYIDHKRHNHLETRFHWQSRLGGIDSYTFCGTATRGIETNSNTYQQTIYPKFNGMMSASSSNTTVFHGELPQNTTASDNGGALVPRIAGFSDDQYPSIRKHKVDAFGNGSATSKPLCTDERQMIEDMVTSPNVWVERGYHAKVIFKEDFSSYTSVTEVSNNWDFTSGGLTTGSGDDFVTDEGHITGDKALQVGDNSGNDFVRMHTKTTFNYDPTKLYEFEIRVKGMEYQNNNAPLYFGFNGLAENGTTYINTSGSDLVSSQHYFGASEEQLSGNDKYVVIRGYISGYIREAGPYGGARPHLMNHAKAYTGVKKFEPLLIINYGGDTFDGIGKTIIDYIKVTEYTADDNTQNRMWSTLNKNYYVPVLIKDGAQQIFNSEELTTVTVNYVESRKKRTIIT